MMMVVITLLFSCRIKLIHVNPIPVEKRAQLKPQVVLSTALNKINKTKAINGKLANNQSLYLDYIRNWRQTLFFMIKHNLVNHKTQNLVLCRWVHTACSMNKHGRNFHYSLLVLDPLGCSLAGCIGRLSSSKSISGS